MTIHGAHRRRRSLSVVLFVTAIALTPIAAQRPADKPGDCNRPMAEPITQFNLPGGHPTPTRDGCWLFTLFVNREGVTGGSGISVLRRTGDVFQEVRTFAQPVPRLALPPRGELSAYPSGMALTRDDKILVLSHGQWLTFLDVEKLRSGGEPVLGRIEGPRISRSWGVAISPDDKYVFASQLETALVAMVDLEKARASGFKNVDLSGLIPTAQRAIVPVVSPDGRYVYASANVTPDVIDAPRTCDGGTSTEGAIQVIDVQKARKDPQSATIGFASPAGCQPQAMTLSGDGTRLSTTAGGGLGAPANQAASGTVAVFDTQPLRAGKPPALIGKIPVPSRPLSLADDGKRIFVGFMADSSSKPILMVIDAAKAGSGEAAIMGTIPVYALNLRLSADGRTLFATGPDRSGLAVIDLERVPLQPVKK